MFCMCHGGGGIIRDRDGWVYIEREREMARVCINPNRVFQGHLLRWLFSSVPRSSKNGPKMIFKKSFFGTKKIVT